MRASLLLISVFLTPALASCGEGSPLPGKVPVNALSSMYTTTPAEQVAGCIAKVVNGSAQNDGADYVVTGSGGTTYSVGPNEGKSVYPVRVIVRGSTVSVQESERVALCLRANAEPA